MINSHRRAFFHVTCRVGLSALMVSFGLRSALSWAAESRPAFESRTLDEVFKALGISHPQQSTDITFKAPEIAENGAVVPLEVESKLPQTRSIILVVEKNPHVMTADFSIPEGTEPFIATRVKVAESSNVHAIVKTDAGAFYATKLVKVTLGGCGG
ncbi:MAG: thiosulfate oxidation carrier protein SoxY [Gammaproteobacteria bacterium]|nr:thiosulfate oxidation carrier protein SoxY [Gammaproteobacteria bacterium]